MRYLLLLLVLTASVVSAEVVVPADKVQNSVNIRLDPDADSDIVGELRKGESMQLVSTLDGWYEVQLEGNATGFVSADWAQVEPDPVADPEPVAAEAAPTVEPAPEPEPVAAEAAPTIEPEPEPEPEPVAAEAAPTIEPEVKAREDFIVKARGDGRLVNSQIFDDGNQVGIGTNEPGQRLDVNGSIQIHDRNSNVAGLMITASTGDTGYVMHNRANTLTIGSGSIDRITIDRDGNVGIGVARPEHPLELASGAYVTAGGAWTNRSSRDDKENIKRLSAGDALAAVLALEPVSFNYTAEKGEGYVGFVAEDVPALLATGNGDALSSMDIIAALTRVVQQQQQRIEALEAKLEAR